MITVVQEPSTVTPAYNPINFVVSSNNVALPSFQYVFDLYVRGSFVSRHRLPPKTFTGIARLDVSSLVQAYVTHDIDINDTSFDRNPNSWVDLYINYGEEYAVSGVITTFINMLQGNTRYAVNASLEDFQFAEFNNNTYYKGTVRKFLTSISEPRVLSNTKMWLHFYHETPASIDLVRIRTFNSAGALLGIDSFIPTDLSNSSVGDSYLRISVGTSQLKNIFANPNFFDGVSYYTVEVKNVGVSPAFTYELKKIVIQEGNCKYENIPVHFLNVHGGLDVFNFKLASNKNSAIERKKYNTMLGSFNSSNNYIYQVGDRSSQSINSSSQDSLTVNSDWITDAESVWLKELITSPIVFMERAGVLIPISITESKYKTNKKVNDRLFNLQVTFDFGNQNYRQSY